MYFEETIGRKATWTLVGRSVEEEEEEGTGPKKAHKAVASTFLSRAAGRRGPLAIWLSINLSEYLTKLLVFPASRRQHPPD